VAIWITLKGAGMEGITVGLLLGYKVPTGSFNKPFPLSMIYAFSLILYFTWNFFIGTLPNLPSCHLLLLDYEVFFFKVCFLSSLYLTLKSLFFFQHLSFTIF